MSRPAFYVAPENWEPELCLKGEEARHAVVLRLRPGDEIIVLNGEGLVANCRIKEMDRKKIGLELLSERKTPRPKALSIIALALSKATRRGFFLEKAAELGAAEIWLWRAQRSQGRVSGELVEACQGQLIAGCKQCHNPWLPKARALYDAREVAKAASQATWRILPWEAQNGIPMLGPEHLGREGVSLYVIGPEGGFDQAEIDVFLAAGFMPASLGNRALRCETAATLCLGLHWHASQLPGHPDFHAVAP